MNLVVDASVACKWFAEETGSAAAEKLLAGDDALLAPDLIVPEVCSVLWKKQRNGEMESQQAAAAIEELPGFLDDMTTGTRLAARALVIAESLDHPVYDCFYLALAELRDAPLVTADRRLLNRLAGTPWARHVQDIEG